MLLQGHKEEQLQEKKKKFDYKKMEREGKNNVKTQL